MRLNRTVAAAVALTGLLAIGGIASAHAHLQRSNIAPNRVVTVAPNTLDLSFTEALRGLQVEVLDLQGHSVTAGDAVISAADTRAATVALKPGLPEGTYTVKLTMESEDGHTSSQRYQFHVTSPGDAGATRLFWNGKEIKSDVPITMVDGRNMVSIRAVAEALGKTIEWDSEQRFVVVTDAPAAAGHAHATFKQPEGSAAPTVQLHVTPDPLGGFNLNLETTHWTWTPEKVNTEAMANEGHAHLYVDGKKMGRIYGPWYNLSGLTPGPHDIRVVLSANDHSDYADADGHVLSDTVSVIQGVDGKGAVGDDHGEEHGHSH